jgi:hypothetical protein
MDFVVYLTTLSAAAFLSLGIMILKNKFKRFRNEAFMA